MPKLVRPTTPAPTPASTPSVKLDVIGHRDHQSDNALEPTPVYGCKHCGQRSCYCCPECGQHVANHRPGCKADPGRQAVVPTVAPPSRVLKSARRPTSSPPPIPLASVIPQGMIPDPDALEEERIWANADGEDTRLVNDLIIMAEEEGHERTREFYASGEDEAIGLRIPVPDSPFIGEEPVVPQSYAAVAAGVATKPSARRSKKVRQAAASAPPPTNVLGTAKQELVQANQEEIQQQMAEAPTDWTPDAAQPKNSKREVEQDRRFDTTQLKSTGHGYSVHRDYAAHFFRWGFAKRFCDKDAFVLDVGCGQEQPLARVLAHGQGGNVPALMIAVDYNPIPKPFNASWLTTWDKFDFTTRWQECMDRLPNVEGWEKGFDVITNFEVIEHMHICDGARLLSAFRNCLSLSGRLILSTPVFNGRAAANHIHEYTIPELQEAIEIAGMKVVDRYGTFASRNDLVKVMTPEHRQAYDGICSFYDGDVAACFLAPLYPDASRNNVWVCERAD